MSVRLGVAVVGCGLIGQRRAAAAAAHPASRCVAVADTVPTQARRVGSATGAEVVDDWRRLLGRRDVDVIVASTPNGYLADIAVSALRAGKHVLVEKPMGRNLAEAERMRAAACASGRLLKVGFNHRYHPGLAGLKKRLDEGAIGRVISIRARYGHGGRAGYENEWRGSRDLAGGGELTDQGVHIADLIHWCAGVPTRAYGVLQTAVWPLGDLEDNAFGVFRFESGAVASFHTSWTQWKNLFSFEVFGDRGALVVEGLGRSYGTETLTVQRRRPAGGAPDVETVPFDGEDISWREEWADLLGAVLDGRRMLGTADDGVVAMRMLEAVYRSAAQHAEVAV